MAASPAPIPLTAPDLSGKERRYVAEAVAARQLAGDGGFTKRCHAWLERETGAAKALLTHSCTAALEMAALLLDIMPGDEVIMPSYTFVSTANAFVLRGGVPVFVDIRRDTLNLDERLIEAAITPRTRAIAVVHYAGIACEMDAIMAAAARHGLAVVEDAAQGLLATYRGQALGSIGALGALSFHETKNVVSGEGGALLVNDASLAHRAEIVREKGTDRSRFLRGETDKYTWQDIGSSFLPSEIVAAFLLAQLEEARAITERRLRLWRMYDELLAPLEASGALSRPGVPAECTPNGHIYYVMLASDRGRQAVIDHLAAAGVRSAFHYVPLHNSPAGQRFGRAVGDLTVTAEASRQLLRLPLHAGLAETDLARIAALLREALD